MSTVKIKRSGTTTSTPSSLDHGELAINYADATLFWKDATNTIKSFVFQAYASATHKSQHATGGSDALTPSDIGAAPAASPAITGNATFQASSGVPVTITNTGTGNSFVVNDAAGDTTPFVVDADGKVGIGSSQTFGVSSRLHVADTGVSSTAVVTIQGTAAGTSASPLVPSSLVFRNFQFDTSAANARQLVRIDALSREQAVATGAAVFYCSNSSGVATEYFRIDPHLNGCISALPLVTPAGTAAAPAIVSGTGTSDTGLFWPAADTVAISTAGGERVRVRSDGNVAIGGTGSASSQLNIQSALTGGTAVNGIYSSQTVSSDVTSAASVFRTFVGTQNASFTLPTLVHFNASANTFGASSTVTTQVGFLAGSTLTGATSNYGFQGSIASGSGRYNLYMSGTADNYLAGNVGIGSSRTSPASALDVNGVITVSAGTAAAPAIVASGDSNTGWWFPSADNAAASTGGVERLRVKSTGAIRFVPLTADPGTADAGDVYYNSSTNKLRVYNGTSWIDLH